jgi:hypothetical protein
MYRKYAKLWAGHVAGKEEIRNTHKILVRIPEGKRPHGKPRHRWQGVDWMHPAQNRSQWWALPNTAMNLRVL